MTAAPQHLRGLTPAPVNIDKLSALQDLASQARDLDHEIADLEERLEGAKDKLNALYSKTMPELMDEIGVDRIGLPKAGNMPPMDARLQNFYSANIAANWDQERKQKGFETLTKMGAEDLIKTKIIVELPRGQKKQAIALLEKIQKNKGVAATISESVNAQTLKSWLKDLVENHRRIPPRETLEAIGGVIGRIVRLEARKE